MSIEDILKEMAAEEQRNREHLPAAKAVLCDALTARGIATVSIGYDGEGDSGQVNDITALDPDRQSVSLDPPVSLALHKSEQPTSYDTLYEALDDFAWMALQAYHDGFVNNDGGCGTITIDAAKRTVTVDHNDRVIDFHTTVTEI